MIAMSVAKILVQCRAAIAMRCQSQASTREARARARGRGACASSIHARGARREAATNKPQDDRRRARMVRPLVAALLVVCAYAPHCPHECPDSARIAGSDFAMVGGCDGGSHCRDCDACRFAEQMRQQKAAEAAAKALAEEQAREAAERALISPTPPPPAIPEQDKRWIGDCHESCRKVDQCQEFHCHACGYCEEQVRVRPPFLSCVLARILPSAAFA